MFFQLCGVYAFGFCGTSAPVGSLHWWAGAALGLAPLLCIARRGDPFVAVERWPLTNCALFPWYVVSSE